MQSEGGFVYSSPRPDWGIIPQKSTAGDSTKAKDKGCHVPQMGVGGIFPFRLLGLKSVQDEPLKSVHYAWTVPWQTYGYLPSCRGRRQLTGTELY